MRRNRTFLAVCLLVGGCTILGPIQNPDRFFTLTAVQGIPAADDGGAPAVTGPAAGVVYGLGPIKLPAYLDRNEIATRISPTEVRYSNLDRWAEQLPANVSAVLEQDLSSLLGTARVIVFPWPHEADVTYQIEITFNRFDVDLAGQSQLLAKWAIKDTRQGRYVALRETALTRAGEANDTPAAVVAMSTLLGELSGEIATALRAIPPPAEAPGKPPSR